MSDTRATWVQAIMAGIVIVGTVFGVWIAVRTESAVHAEQIRQLNESTSRLEKERKDNTEHIRSAESEIDGLIPVVNAIKEISNNNSIKLDALLLRSRIANPDVTVACKDRN